VKLIFTITRLSMLFGKSSRGTNKGFFTFIERSSKPVNDGYDTVDCWVVGIGQLRYLNLLTFFLHNTPNL
jgi:hypothetical protein